MITLQINDFDLLNLESELNLKIDGIKALDSTTVLTELANAVFTLSGKAFIKALNLEAKAKPKAYHHIYEWGKIGTEAGRLFFLYRQSNAEGVLSIKPGFVQSRTPVPISSELMMPGKTGKSVAAKTIFKNKANVMETGKPVVYRASKNLPIPSGGTLKFVAA